MTDTEDTLICRDVWKVFGARAAEHLAALLRHGPCPEHRRSYGPVHQASLFHPAETPAAGTGI